MNENLEIMVSHELRNRQFPMLVGIVFLVSLGIRLFINFHAGLLHGTNGGYYPVMVRGIVQSGTMPFSDMPLLFYLYAGIIKIISLVTGIPSAVLILPVLQVIDALLLPLCLLPLAGILLLASDSLYKNTLCSFVILSWLGFSFFSLVLTGDLGKNALAILFACTAIFYIFKCSKTKRWLYAVLASFFLILVPLTHFGTFSFLLAQGLLFGLFALPVRQWIWLPISSGILVIIVYFFDSTRFLRLLYFWNALFEHPDIGSLSVLDMAAVAFSILLASMDIIILIKSWNHATRQKKAAITACAVTLIIFSLPIYDIEYVRRFMLLLIIPQTLSLLIVATLLPQNSNKLGWTAIIIFCLCSAIVMLSNPKQPVITLHELRELQNLSDTCNDSEEQTLVIAPHGLEWWTAWALKTKVTQEKAYTVKLHEEYKNIYYLMLTSARPAGGHASHPHAIKPSGPKTWRGSPPPVMQGIPAFQESHIPLGCHNSGVIRKTPVIKNEYVTLWKIDVE